VRGASTSMPIDKKDERTTSYEGRGIGRREQLDCFR
jgi:hypothetical protein